jgi:hypothetical protein
MLLHILSSLDANISVTTFFLNVVIPLRLLEKDITKFLTAILIGTTTCTIYSAAIFTDMVAQYFGDNMVT